MARTLPSFHPFQTLRETTTSLEAAVLLCLARPGKVAIHRLRTSTRRVEAQLQLLAILTHQPPKLLHARKALRLLKKLRRAAGAVRDIDVQRDLLRDEAASSKKRRPDPELRKQSRQLRRDLKLDREKLANDLLQLLNKHQAEIPLLFEKLLDSLAPTQSLELTEAELTRVIRDWFEEYARSSAASASTPSTEQLHSVRKQAKIARYLAESAPESAKSARHLAAHFEKLQQAGGEWHDWLLLAGLAAHHLGGSARLPQSLDQKTARALRIFEQQLRTSRAGWRGSRSKS